MKHAIFTTINLIPRNWKRFISHLTYLLFFLQIFFHAGSWYAIVNSSNYENNQPFIFFIFSFFCLTFCFQYFCVAYQQDDFIKDLYYNGIPYDCIFFYYHELKIKNCVTLKYKLLFLDSKCGWQFVSLCHGVVCVRPCRQFFSQLRKV
jgi:hypothetical protein